MANETTAVNVIPADVLLESWQGHRRLTRRVIEAFPDEKLFTFSVGGMRSFGTMALEMIGMAVPVAKGVATGTWTEFKPGTVETKAALLSLWDEQTPVLEKTFRTIPPERFSAVDKAFGQWEMSGIGIIQYAIDNEIHHRGEGYVYLRALGIEPPPFWERG